MIVIVTLDITLGGGIERVVTNKSNSLVSKGNHVKVISFFKSNNSIKYDLDPRISVIYLSNFKFTKNYKIYLMLLFFKLLNNIHSSDIIVSMYPIISIPLAITKYRNKVIASEHSEFFSQGKIIRFFRKHTYNRLLCVVTLTKQGKEEFSKINIFAHRIPNFSFFNRVKKKDFKKLIKILFIGRFEDVKNPLLFVDIANWFEKKSLLKIKFEMYGEGSLKESIEKLIKKRKNIKLYPFSNNIENILEKSHGLILTSKTEAFPMVAIESITKDVIVYGLSSQVGTKEIIGTQNQRIVNPHEINNLCLQIEKDFKTKKNYLTALSENSINIKQYDKVTVINQWENIINSLVKSN